MEKVVLKGDELLEKQDRYMMNKIVNSYLDKIKREIKNDFVLKVGIKEYQKAGNNKKGEKVKKAHKFSIKLDVATSLKNLESHASDWDLNRTLHAAFKNLLSEIEHMFRVSEQGRK